MQGIERELFYYTPFLWGEDMADPVTFGVGEIFPIPESGEDIFDDSGVITLTRDIYHTPAVNTAPEAVYPVSLPGEILFSDSIDPAAAPQKESDIEPAVVPSGLYQGFLQQDILQETAEMPFSHSLEGVLSHQFPKDLAFGADSVLPDEEEGYPAPPLRQLTANTVEDITSTTRSQVHIHNEIPSINIEFSGSIDKSVDVEALLRDIQGRLREEMASGSDFAYSF